MKRKRMAWLLAIALCCGGMQAEAAQTSETARRLEALGVPTQSPEAVDKERAERYYRLGLAALEQRDAYRALDAFREAIRADRMDARLYWARGKVLQQVGDENRRDRDRRITGVFVRELEYAFVPHKRRGEMEDRQNFLQFYLRESKTLTKAYSAALWNYAQAMALGSSGATTAELFRRCGVVYSGRAEHAATILRFKREEDEYFRFLNLLEPQKQAEHEIWQRQKQNTIEAAATRVEGEFDKALESYDEALRLNPQDADAYAGRGAVYYERGRYRLVKAGAPSAYWAERFTWRTMPENATRYNFSDDWRAIADFKRAQRLRPKDGRIWNALGKAYEAVQAVDKAVDSYNRALRQPGMPLDDSYGRMFLYVDAKRKKITDLPKSVLKKIDNDIGYEIDSRQRFDHARNTMEDILSITEKIAVVPEDGRLYEQRAALWIEFNAYANAVDDYTRAEKYGVKDAVLYEKRCVCYQHLARNLPNSQNQQAADFWTRALADWERAKVLDSAEAWEYEKTDMHLRRARAYTLLKQYQAAADDYTQVLRRSKGKDRQTYWERSECYLNAGKYHLAAADLWQFLLHCKDAGDASQRMNAIRAYRRLAELYADDLHDDAKAVACYDAILRLEPQDNQAHSQRAALFIRKGKAAHSGAEKANKP